MYDRNGYTNISGLTHLIKAFFHTILHYCTLQRNSSIQFKPYTPFSTNLDSIKGVALLVNKFACHSTT